VQVRLPERRDASRPALQVRSGLQLRSDVHLQAVTMGRHDESVRLAGEAHAITGSSSSASVGLCVCL